MVFRIVTISNKLLDFVEDAVHHYNKNLKSLGGKLEIILLKRRGKFNDLNEQRKHDTNLLLEWITKEQHSSMNIVLDPTGKQLSTEQLSEYIPLRKRINFIIGGDVGISKNHEIWNVVDLKISVSPWILSHQVCVVLCAEQAWRLLSIIRRHPYHK